jgi:hypothetical protein
MVSGFRRAEPRRRPPRRRGITGRVCREEHVCRRPTTPFAGGKIAGAPDLPSSHNATAPVLVQRTDALWMPPVKPSLTHCECEMDGRTHLGNALPLLGMLCDLVTTVRMFTWPWSRLHPSGWARISTYSSLQNPFGRELALRPSYSRVNGRASPVVLRAHDSRTDGEMAKMATDSTIRRYSREASQ